MRRRYGRLPSGDAVEASLKRQDMIKVRRALFLLAGLFSSCLVLTHGAAQTGTSIELHSHSGSIDTLASNWLDLNTPSIVYRSPIYRLPDAKSPTLSVRPYHRVQCFSKHDPRALLKQQVGQGVPVILDQNRYLEPLLVPVQRVQELFEDIAERNAFSNGELYMYAGEFSPVSSVLYDALGISGLTLSAGAPESSSYFIDAYCYLLDGATNETPADSLNPDGFECHDAILGSESIFGDRFEPGGNLGLYVNRTYSVLDPDSPYPVTLMGYDILMTAQGGDVQDLRLREQFPFHVSSSLLQVSENISPEHGQSLFGRSLELDRVWRCSVSGGASCGDIEQLGSTGVGSITLNNASLPEGSCMKVSTTRIIHTSGLHGTNRFSGQLHISALYGRNPQVESQPVFRQTRVNFNDAPTPGFLD